MRRSILLVGFAVACDNTPQFQTIVVDIAANCNEAQVVPAVTGFTDARVIDAASDGPDEPGWWLLVSAPEEPNAPETLQLWHTVGDEVDVRVPLGLPPDLEHAMSLRPGATPGQAWLLRRSDGVMVIWHVDANESVPLVGVSHDLGGFPATNRLCRDAMDFPSRCDTSSWRRDLLLLGDEGAPFVVAVPPFSPTASTYVYLGDLLHGSGSSLFLVQEREFEFESRCDPALPIQDFATCEERNRDVTYDVVEALAVQQDLRRSHVNVLLYRERVDGVVPAPIPDIVVLTLGLSSSGITGGLVKAEPKGRALPMVGLSGIAVDDHATYVLHQTYDRGPQLVRLPNRGSTFTVLEDIALEGATLMQLDADIALSRVVSGSWEITKVFPDSPRQSRVTVHETAEPLLGVAPAGPGAFLLRQDDGAVDLVHVRCVD